MNEALTAVAGSLATVLIGAALVAGAVALAATRRPALALGVLLDLLLAAGLLRLVGSPDWRVVVTAAAVVAIRHLVSYGLRLGARSWTGGPDRAGAPQPVAETARRLLRPAWRR